MNATVKKVIFNDPATIVYWTDNTKTVVKCCKDDKFDAETGLAMAICKRYLNDVVSNNQGIFTNWKDFFKKDLVTGEWFPDQKSIALLFVRMYYNRRFTWYQEFKDLIKNATVMTPKVKNEPKDIIVNNSFNEKVAKEVKAHRKKIKSDRDVIKDLFNKGLSIRKIAKTGGFTEYRVKKTINKLTSPNVSVKKKRGGVQIPITITTPKYLDEETGKKILEETKAKYAGKWKYTSDLNKLYLRECKLEYIRTHYGQGYSMFDIAKVIGTNAAGVNRLWNDYLRKIAKVETGCTA